MTDTPISGLPAAAGANDADQLPANQSGTTRRVTVAQIRARIEAAGIPWSALTGVPADLTNLAAGGLPTLIVSASGYAGYADYTCDGTDDQVQLQAAIDALGAGGGTIQLTAGTYVVAGAGSVSGDSLTTPYCVLIDAADGPITIRGAGMGATTIRLAASQASNTISLLIRGSSATPRTAPTRLEALTIDGNAAGQLVAWGDFAPVTLAYARGVRVEGCEFKNSPFSNFLAFRQSYDLVFIGNVSRMGAAFDNEIRIEQPRFVVSGNTFYGNDGTVAAAAACLSLNNNTDITTQAESGIVVGNLFVGGPIGVALGGTSRIVVTGNTFRDMTAVSGAAISLTHNSQGAGYNCSDNLIANNQVYNCRRGVRLNGTTSLGCVRNMVSQNVIIDGPDASLGEGILVSNNAGNSENQLLYNNIIGATTGISVSDSAHATRRGNRIYNSSGVLTTRDALVNLSNETTNILPLSAGGTGGTSAATARTSLGTNDAANITAGVLLPERGGVLNRRRIVPNAGVADWGAPGAVFTGVGTRALTADRAFYTPWYVSHEITIDLVAVEVTTLINPSTVALALYVSTANHQPGALVRDLGTIDSSTTGVKSIDLTSNTLTLTPGIYLAAVASRAAPTLRAFFSGLGNNVLPALGTNPFRGYLAATSGYTGTWADPGNAWAIELGSTGGIGHMMVCRTTS